MWKTMILFVAVVVVAEGVGCPKWQERFHRDFHPVVVNLKKNI